VATQAAFLFVYAVTPSIIGSRNLPHAAAGRQRSGQQHQRHRNHSDKDQVPRINHIVAPRLSALLTKRPARLADLGSDLDQAIVVLRRTAIRAHIAHSLCVRDGA
jgi:hypothetical protein